MSSTRISQIDRCSASQLKALLGLAAAESHGAGVLGTLREGPDLERLLTELCEDAKDSAEALLAALIAPDTPLTRLAEIKDLAKTMLAGARTEQHRATATLLYHGAIAAGFTRHGARISSVPVESRFGLYEDLATVTVDPLAQLFREASDRIAATGEQVS